MVGEVTLKAALKSVPFPEAKGSILASFDQFQERFNDLYAIPSEKYQAEKRTKAFQWADSIKRNLNASEREVLKQKIRQWTGILVRDLTPTLDGDGQKLVSKRFVVFENIFAQKVPEMVDTFCLDPLVADTSEEAAQVAAQLKVLNQKLVELNQYTLKMEKELVGRLRDHPEFPDHWYHFASFLFARGRLLDSEAQLRELFKLNPKHKKGNRLLGHIKALKKVKNPVARARRIREITVQDLAEAAKEVKEQLARTPANRDRLPRAPKHDPTGRVRPTPEFVE